MHDETSELFNRGHDTQCFVDGVNKLRAHNIEVVVHVINGLPKETEEMMLDTVKFVSKMDIQGIKIHLLHVMSDTKLVNQLNNGFLELMERQT